MNLSPMLTQRLFDALAVLVLSDGTRHAIEGTDPKAFTQALDALDGADPSLMERLHEARGAVRLRREQALMRSGGAHILVDGTPMCRVSYHRFHADTASKVYAPCWQADVPKVVAAVEALRALNPELKITYKLGGCPREES
jgi:hypothetical protein